MHPKRTILCARFMLSMETFSYLAFLLISGPALGIILQSLSVFADINARTLKTPLLSCGPQRGSNALQRVLSSHGAHAQNSLLRLIIVQVSRRPGHAGDKRILLNAPRERKYLFTQSVPTNVILRSAAGSPRRRKCGGLNKWGECLVR